MNKIVSFFILILVCSCSDRKEHIANILSMNSIDIKTNRINKDEVIARGAFPFEMIDSLFFLFNGDPSSGALVLCESNASELGHFLQKGNGFGECITPGYIGHCNDTIYVSERSRTRRMTYLLSNHNDSLQYKCLEDVSPKMNSEFYYQICRLQSGLFVGARLFGKEHLFTLLDESLDTLTTFARVPIDIEENANNKLAPFIGHLCIDDNTVYYASNDFSYMAAYDILSEKEIKPVFERMYISPIIQKSANGISLDKYKHLLGFGDIRVYQNYIFATYIGKPDITMDQENDISALVPTHLLVFNKDGVPIVKFKFPFKIRSFVFTKSKMYLLDVDCNIESVDLVELWKRLPD